ncbi:MAG: hypothetical protein IJG87_03275 [Ruminococcus sp.]|nr:hypothetical protein [Ruminococcus sp.]
MFGDFIISSRSDLIGAIDEYGFLPFFSNSIEGFSVEEHIDPACWYCGESVEWQAWEWKGSVIRETGCAYGKFFEKKACYISPEWFSELANYRRDGYDFDARRDDGLAPQRDVVLYDLIAEHAPILSKELKKIGDYRKGGNKGFDTTVTRLQAQCYVLISDFVYMRDRFGEPYGWGVAEYSTPERFMGSRFTDHVYQRTPEESYERIAEHFRKLFPYEEEQTLTRFIKHQ